MVPGAPPSGGTPQQFRWVDPGGQPSGSRSRKRWWLGAAIGLVIVVVAGAVAVAVWGPFRQGDRGAAPPSAAPPVGSPKDLLLSFPLNRELVPGWQLKAPDIGLPAAVGVGEFFAGSGNTAFFITDQGCEKKCANPVGWLYGIDMNTGRPVFPPISLPGYDSGAGHCYRNGPTAAICTTTDDGLDPGGRPPPGLWVVDLQRGALTFTGPNTLNPTLAQNAPALMVAGSYVVLALHDQGVFGIGPQGQRTWSVAGSGVLQALGTPAAADLPAQPLIVQAPRFPPRSPTAGQRYQVISVVDGRDLTPNAPSGTKLEEAVVYNGGFAYQFDAGTVTGTLIYDSDGRLVGRQEPARSFPQQNAGMLTLRVGAKFQIYTDDGKLLIEIPAQDFGGQFQTIGTKLFVRAPEGAGGDESWQWWDLLTRQPGPTCRMQLGAEYVGSDGTIVISRRTLEGYAAIDTSSCRTLWQLPAAKRIDIRKVGTGLVRIDHEQQTISSLRAPN